jgi:cytochrome c oxidase subunit II
MTIALYERIWMWGATGLIVLFLGSIFVTAVAQAVEPPGLLETLDPTTVLSNPEFGKPAITTNPDGSVVVPVVAGMFSFTPDPIEVPANVRVTFRLTSPDVIHGFQVVGTNANAMAIPGYVTQFTVTFAKAGEYAIACNEYCGLLHHNMVGKLIVK